MTWPNIPCYCYFIGVPTFSGKVGSIPIHEDPELLSDQVPGTEPGKN